MQADQGRRSVMLKFEDGPESDGLEAAEEPRFSGPDAAEIAGASSARAQPADSWGF